MIARTWLAAAVMAMAAVACSAPSAAPSQGDASPSTGTGSPTVGSAAEDPGSSTESPTESRNEATVEADADQRHPSGTSATVTDITVDGRGVYVGFEAFNGSPDPKILANAAQFVVLRDDQGNTYRWEPPAENPELALDSNEELTARLAFVGPLRGEPDSLELLVNWSPDTEQFVNLEQASNDFDSFHFENLPVPEA